MSYKIQYTPETAYRYPQNKAKKFKWGDIAVLFCILAALTWFRFYGIPEFLIPGDPVVTKAAASGFVAQIRSGEPLREAVTVFCKEILIGAGVESIT